MDAPPGGIAQLITFVQEKLRVRTAQPFDWQPVVEPPKAYDRRLKTCPAPEFTPPAGSVDQARQTIRTAIAGYLEIPAPSYMLLVRAMPGTGKTTAAVESIDGLAGKRVAYAGPRHNLFADVLAKSTSPQDWYEWLPRQAEDPDAGKIQTCNYVTQITEWLNKGYEAMDFCSGICKWDYIRDGCVYHAQKRRTERVIYTQHQHVTLGHPLRFDVLIGDESPVAAFAREWRIPGRWIFPPGMAMDEPLTEVVSWLAAIASSTTKPVQGPELLEYLGGPETVLQACEMFSVPLSKLYKGSIHRAEEVDQTPYFHLPALVYLLSREARQARLGVPYPHRVIVSANNLTLLLRHTIDYDQIPPHVIWLDATGRPEIYERIFQREVRVVDARARTYGKIYQVVDRANGKDATVKNGRTTEKGKQVEAVIQRVIQERGYTSPSIISYKDFVENTELQAKTGHFYAARGTNEHEDADAVFIVGAPQANIYDVVKLAKMIFLERDAAFRVEWVVQDRPYSYIDDDGQGRCYPVSGFWHDPDLQAVLEMIREDEIVQAAHRGRPVNHPVDIWLFTNVPIESLPTDELLTMRELMDAPEGVDIFGWARVQKLMEIRDVITTTDIEGLGISRKTAAKYIEFLCKMPGWQPAAVKTGGRGKPRSGARRNIA